MILESNFKFFSFSYFFENVEVSKIAAVFGQIWCIMPFLYSKSVAASKGLRKFWEKSLFGQIWPLEILSFFDFEVLVILPFSKIFDYNFNLTKPFYRPKKWWDI